MKHSKKRPGRPKVHPASASLRIAIDRSDIEAAQILVADFDRTSTLGVRHTRIDVLRAAIRRGLEALRSELEQPAG